MEEEEEEKQEVRRRRIAGGRRGAKWRRGAKERALSQCREALQSGDLWNVLLPLQTLALSLSQATSPPNLLTKSGGAGEVVDLLSDVLDMVQGSAGAEQEVSRSVSSNVKPLGGSPNLQ